MVLEHWLEGRYDRWVVQAPGCYIREVKNETSLFAGGVDSLPAAEQESNDDITEGEKDPTTSTRTRQVYLVI
jgi:hypothetical protein